MLIKIIQFTFSILWKLVLAAAILAIVAYSVVDYRTDEYIYDSIDSLPFNRAGILLGTAKYVPDGGINLYYKYRIDAAVELYRKGKIEKLIASGDNGTIYYNEPIKMQQDLMARGIPKEDIILDYAGFSTLDAVVRAEAVFSQESFTVISQGFHNARAVYIARSHGIEAIAYSAKDVKSSGGLKTNLREYLARVKMMLDIYILGTEPKFYGDKIEV